MIPDHLSLGPLGATTASANIYNPNAEQTEYVRMFGAGYAFGQPATDSEPETEGNVKRFRPKHICAVYIRFEPNGTLTVKQAYIAAPNPQPTNADIVAVAEPLLQAMSKAGYAGGGAQAFKENFEDFSFASQQVVVIYLDNKDDAVRFSSKDSDIIRFVPISGNDPKTHIRPNHAFFNRRAVAMAPGGGTFVKRAYLIDFWNTDENGNAITGVIEGRPATYYLYAMNIHLEMATSKRTAKLNWVPIIIDPDTGNMGGPPLPDA